MPSLLRFFTKIRTFWKVLFTNPRSIGAVIPSSPYLANSMSQCIAKTANSLILELGPGTGAITQGILKSGISPHQLFVLELSPHFAEQLKINFPDITVIEGNATQLSSLVQNKKFDSIISSLPLRSLPTADREKILTEIPKVLVLPGKFIQFTYALMSREKFYPGSFKLTKSFIEWRNIPPARIDVFTIGGK